MKNAAVSPVIGVILMVAITVILAAIIAVLVYGMAEEVQGTRIVGVTSAIDHKNLTVTYNGGPDHQELAALKFRVDGEIYTPVGVQDFGDDPEVGEQYVLGELEKGPHSLLVVAVFHDGYEQVIYSHNYQIPE